MAVSQLNFIFKTNHCIQQDTSISLVSYSAGAVDFFSRTIHIKIRSTEVLVKIYQYISCEFCVSKQYNVLY